MLPVLLLAAVAAASGEKVKLGDIQTLHHAVSGEVFALNEKTLMVQNFNYDGAGPDAFFWVGVEGTPDNVKNESTTAILAHPFQGKHYEYRNEDAPILGAASNEAVTLILPEHLKVSELKWLSVWCRKFSVDFGNVIFATDVKIPEISSLPAPIVPPSNDLKPEPEPESEPEPETEPEPEAESEPESESEPGYEHGSNSIDGEPESEPSTKSEPEPEPHGAGVALNFSLISVLTALVASRLL